MIDTRRIYQIECHLATYMHLLEVYTLVHARLCKCVLYVEDRIPETFSCGTPYNGKENRPSKCDYDESSRVT